MFQRPFLRIWIYKMSILQRKEALNKKNVNELFIGLKNIEKKCEENENWIENKFHAPYPFCQGDISFVFEASSFLIIFLYLIWAIKHSFYWPSNITRMFNFIVPQPLMWSGMSFPLQGGRQKTYFYEQVLDTMGRGIS